MLYYGINLKLQTHIVTLSMFEKHLNQKKYLFIQKYSNYLKTFSKMNKQLCKYSLDLRKLFLRLLPLNAKGRSSRVHCTFWLNMVPFTPTPTNGSHEDLRVLFLVKTFLSRCQSKSLAPWGSVWAKIPILTLNFKLSKFYNYKSNLNSCICMHINCIYTSWLKYRKFRWQILNASLCWVPHSLSFKPAKCP